jgi:hypothetical protein
MALPADNGNAPKEKKEGDARINHVCNTGAYVQQEVKMNKPAPKEDCIFGRI